ncbi:MAG: hypothetical protein LJE92_07650 [Gammaproteobacteria bacterium]|nr:hypothetical protein [Gammaproteobacteria bacterium]
MNCGQRQLEQKWSALPFGEVRFTSDDEQHVFAAQLYLDKLGPEAVCAELYANGLETGAPERIEMKATRQLVGAVSGCSYHAEVPATPPAADYTLRVIPRLDCLAGSPRSQSNSGAPMIRRDPESCLNPVLTFMYRKRKEPMRLISSYRLKPLLKRN